MPTDKPWFDPKTGFLLLDEYVAEMSSYQGVMADGVVSDQELSEQAQRVTSLLKRLETALSPDMKVLATEALCELAVLHSLQHHHTTR